MTIARSARSIRRSGSSRLGGKEPSRSLGYVLDVAGLAVWMHGALVSALVPAAPITWVASSSISSWSTRVMASRRTSMPSPARSPRAVSRGQTRVGHGGYLLVVNLGQNALRITPVAPDVRLIAQHPTGNGDIRVGVRNVSATEPNVGSTSLPTPSVTARNN